MDKRRETEKAAVRFMHYIRLTLQPVDLEDNLMTGIVGRGLGDSIFAPFAPVAQFKPLFSF